MKIINFKKQKQKILNLIIDKHTVTYVKINLIVLSKHTLEFES